MVWLFQLILVFAPLSGWILLVHFRSRLITLQCMIDLTSCAHDNIPAFDRWAMIAENESAHHLSFKTQHAMGIALLLIPIAFYFWRSQGLHNRFKTAFKSYLPNLILSLKIVLWNGFINEIAKVVFQRIRPHVYKHPDFAGNNPAHYTSFYSGHTSFTAACATTLIFILVSNGASRGWIVVASFLGVGLTILTAFLRVYASRHFLSDVIAGGLAGFAVAMFWIYREQKKAGLVSRPSL